MVKVSFQGERGAYSEAAARSFFAEEIDTIPLPTFAEVLESTISNKTDYSVLPIENSLEGSVGESYDLLYSTSLNAMGEIYYRIEHCLIGKGKLEEVDTVYSHPQALGQCRDFIQSENIANNLNNYTRFLVLSKKTSEETGNDKTSIIFSIKHEPGSLFRIIDNFNNYKVNLTKIESRPTKSKNWEYNFYVDFEGHANNPQISEMLEKIKKETIFMKILGSYPSAKLN